ATRIIRSSERSGTPRSASSPPFESMRRAASPSRFLCAATISQSRPDPSSAVRASSNPASFMVWAALLGTRLLALPERLAVSRTDDVGAVLRVVEERRVGGFVAAHAGARRDLQLDEPTLRVPHVRASRAMAVLALHVTASDSFPVHPQAAHVHAIDATDPARLLPAGHMTLDAVKAELLLHMHQRLVGVGVLRHCPEPGRVRLPPGP